jgi:hypothetical protein
MDFVESTRRESIERQQQTVRQDNFASNSKSMPRFHKSTNGTSTIGEGIVEAAMAKWECKSRLANLEKENQKFLQEELLHEHFAWL